MKNTSIALIAFVAALHGASAFAQSAPIVPPGLYVQVLDGMIKVSNPAGTQNFAAGQFGFTPGFQQPPVVVPANPAIQFTPPPSFSSSGSTTTTSKSGTVDCEVR